MTLYLTAVCIAADACEPLSNKNETIDAPPKGQLIRWCIYVNMSAVFYCRYSLPSTTVTNLTSANNPFTGITALYLTTSFGL